MTLLHIDVPLSDKRIRDLAGSICSRVLTTHRDPDLRVMWSSSGQVQTPGAVQLRSDLPIANPKERFKLIETAIEVHRAFDRSFDLSLLVRSTPLLHLPSRQ